MVGKLKRLCIAQTFFRFCRRMEAVFCGQKLGVLTGYRASGDLICGARRMHNVGGHGIALLFRERISKRRHRA